MNRILFFSALVCIFCMTASEFLFTGDEFPTPSPDAQSCMKKTKNIEHLCYEPAIKRWHMTDLVNATHPLPILDEHTTHLICCLTWDVSTCYPVYLDKSNCTLSERKAFRDFIEEFDKYMEKTQCVKTTRKSGNCKP